LQFLKAFIKMAQPVEYHTLNMNGAGLILATAQIRSFFHENFCIYRSASLAEESSSTPSSSDLFLHDYFLFIDSFRNFFALLKLP
jgi:hypothetical protein